MKAINTSFTKHELSEGEYNSSVILSAMQKIGIQNLIADTAEEKINLAFDPNNPTNFAQQEADLAGKLTILRYILDLSEAAELATLEQAPE
jgi:hypothetical protein